MSDGDLIGVGRRRPRPGRSIGAAVHRVELGRGVLDVARGRLVRRNRAGRGRRPRDGRRPCSPPPRAPSRRTSAVISADAVGRPASSKVMVAPGSSPSRYRGTWKVPSTTLAIPSSRSSVRTSVTSNSGAPPSRAPMASSRIDSTLPARESAEATVNHHDEVEVPAVHPGGRHLREHDVVLLLAVLDGLRHPWSGCPGGPGRRWASARGARRSPYMSRRATAKRCVSIREVAGWMIRARCSGSSARWSISAQCGTS